MKVVVTGGSGLLGHHAAVRLHAMRRAAEAEGRAGPALALPTRADLSDPGRLAALLRDADAVLHCAGASRGEGVEEANVSLAVTLARAVARSGGAPRIVHANSVRAGEGTPYGRGKARAARILGDAAPLTDIALPHLFGEGGRPHHNSAAATLLAHALAGTAPRIEPGAQVDLLHAGAAAQVAVGALDVPPGALAPPGRRVALTDLWDRLREMVAQDGENIVPDLSDPFARDLFNTMRAARPVGSRPLSVHSDVRGALFETVKGAGQTFASTTHPGVTRGGHFHLRKAERFVVLRGHAAIRLRPALGGPVTRIDVSGDAPTAVDIPTLAAHSIENVGDGELLTLFWTSEIFDPAAPDTYAEPLSAEPARVAA